MLLRKGVPADDPRIRLGYQCLEKMQNRDGSWGMFVKDSQIKIDKPCPALTAHRHYQHPDARERATALLKLAEGHSPHWVARHGLLRRRDPDSIYQWLHFYAEGGLPPFFIVATVGLIGGVFEAQKQAVQERVRQAPPAPADSAQPPASRWTLSWLSDAVP